MSAPEPWLRGTQTGVHPFIAPTLFAYQQAREDLSRWTEGLTEEQMNARPHGVAPLTFQIRHIAGSVERLTTYLTGRQLDDVQLQALDDEQRHESASRATLLDLLDQSFVASEAVLRGIDPGALAERREVGRKRLPTTVAGLVVHLAEHTARHVGEAIITAKLLRPGAWQPFGTSTP